MILITYWVFDKDLAINNFPINLFVSRLKQKVFKFLQFFDY